MIDRPAIEMIGPRRCACVLAIAIAIATSSSRAGPPFQTDDPGIVAYGRSEVLVFYRQTLTQDGRSGVLPGLELHHGAVDNLELDLMVPIAFQTPRGEYTRRGHGDIELGLKYGLIRETDTAPQIGFAPKLDLPTGNADSGLGNGGATLFLPIWIHKLQGSFETYGGGGYGINRGTGNRNYWFVGAVAGYRLTDQWTLGVELFHTTPQTTSQGASTGFNAGGSYRFATNAQWLFSIGRGTRNAAETNRVSTYVGCQLDY